MANKRETFAQLGYLTVTESAANTLTFAGLSVFSNVLGQKGMIIHRAMYNFSAASIAAINAGTDGVIFGLCGTDTLAAISFDTAEVYDYKYFVVVDLGAGTTRNDRMLPYETDFNNLPGGGILVPADRLYAYVQGLNLGTAMELRVRFHYTIIDLTAADYLELAQAMRVLR